MKLPTNGLRIFTAVVFALLVGSAHGQAPSTPLIGSAYAGNAQVFVSFSAPVSSGGSPITTYTATCTPGVGMSATGGTTSPIAVTGLTNNTAVNCSVTATNAAGISPASATVSITPFLTAPLTLIGVKSRKSHGSAGVFDVPIDNTTPLDGMVNVEPRAIGAGHSIVFQFNATVNSAGPVTAIDESAAAVSATPTPVGNEVVVSLTGVADNKRVNVALSTVNGTAVNASASVGFLLGDVNDSRTVNASDISGQKARAGQTTTAANFRSDVSLAGAINSSNIGTTKARAGIALKAVTTPPVVVVARVEIEQKGLILTQTGAVKQLAAKAFDAQGTLLNVPVSWTSSKPATITVDSTGIATAVSGNGASQIVAQAGGVQSAPLLAVVTQPVSGAILLTDAQIVGEPFETTPNAPPNFTNTYQVRLTGVAPPAVGAILINTESKVVAGRVVAVDITGNPIIVTLALVPMRELFPTLVITETIDLANAPIMIPADIAAAYNFTRSGNTFAFTPKVNTVQASAAKATAQASTALNANAAVPSTIGKQQSGATGTRALPPFSACETSITGGGGVGAPLPIALSAPPLFSITASPKLDVKFDLLTVTGVERFVVDAEPVVKFEGGINIAVAFEGKIECKAELFAYVIPVGGPLALIIGGVIPMGVGIEAGGKFTVATMGIGTKVEVKGKVKAGITCPGGNFPCQFDRALDSLSATLTPTLDTPSIGDIRLEPSLSAFGYMEAAIGNVFLKSLRFDFVKIKAGAKLAGSFALKASQLADAAYASDYKLSLEASAAAGANIEGVLALLGLTSVNALELVISTDIAKSPAGLASGAVTADKANFVSADTVNFTVKLDPATVDFLPIIGPYNVKKIQLVRNVGGTISVVGSIDATAGQTNFSFAYAAPDSGTSAQFSAFVVTVLLPLELLSLEVGSVSTTAEVAIINAQVRVSHPVCKPPFSIVVTAPPNQALPMTLVNGGTIMRVAQLSEFVYTVDYSTVLLIGESNCPTGGSNRGSSDAFVNLQIIPRRSGTLKTEHQDEPLARRPSTSIRTIPVVAGIPVPQTYLNVIVDGSFTNAINLPSTRIATLTFTPEVTVVNAEVSVRNPGCPAVTTNVVAPSNQPLPLTLVNGGTGMTVTQQSELIYTVEFTTLLPASASCQNGSSSQANASAFALLQIIPARTGTMTIEHNNAPNTTQASTVTTIQVVAGTPVAQTMLNMMVDGALTDATSLSKVRTARITFTPAP